MRRSFGLKFVYAGIFIPIIFIAVLFKEGRVYSHSGQGRLHGVAKVLPYILFGLSFMVALLVELMRPAKVEHHDHQHNETDIKIESKGDIEVTKNNHLSDMKTTAHFSKTQSRLQKDLNSKKTDKQGKKNHKEEKKDDTVQMNTSYKINTSKNLNLSQNLQNISNIVDLPIFDSENSEINTVDGAQNDKGVYYALAEHLEKEVVVLAFLLVISSEIFSILILYMFILLNTVGAKIKLLKGAELPKDLSMMIAHSGFILLVMVVLKTFVWNFSESSLFKFFISGILFKHVFMNNFDRLLDSKDKVIKNCLQATLGLSIGIYITTLNN